MPGGKADGVATCEGACEGQAVAGCWCDLECEDYGDCCPDVESVCRSGNSACGEDEDEDGGAVVPDEYACEHAFFTHYFEEDNGAGHTALRDEAFARIVGRVEDLQACNSGVTLGGILSLMIFEGGGAPIAFFNDRCAENSYVSSDSCWNTPKARYSYQYGMAPVHTSNFHPCADVGWTSKMRARLEAAAAAAGFEASEADIASVAQEVHSFCPNAEPTAVDYWILAAHDEFGVPTDTSGNALELAGEFPFFSPQVTIDLFFDLLEPSCKSIDDDRDAISVFGGGDSSYRTWAKQTQILSLWQNWQAAGC